METSNGAKNTKMIYDIASSYKKTQLNCHLDVSSEVCGVKFCQSLNLHPNFINFM